jgi:ferritin-like metal-binding protein YciE
MARDIREQLTKYLTDAHSIEEQALQQLRAAPDVAGEPALADALREHLIETEGHERQVRALLEARGAAPAKLKDAVMRAGGAGFVLFARSQADTPGKLAAHALSYEALEWASYDLLARTAERAGEPDVAHVARSIRDQERAMMERIEGLFERTVEASLRETARADLGDQLKTYLSDAHAIEAQAIQLLESGRGMVDDPTLRALFEQHLAETRDQQKLVEQRLEALDGSRSWLKDAAMRIGALNWGMFFQAHPDTSGKLAAFAYAFEHLEIGGYEQLRRVAERAGDLETARIAQQIAEQERRTAERLAGAFDAAVSAALAATVDRPAS